VSPDRLASILAAPRSTPDDVQAYPERCRYYGEGENIVPAIAQPVGDSTQGRGRQIGQDPILRPCFARRSRQEQRDERGKDQHGHPIIGGLHGV